MKSIGTEKYHKLLEQQIRKYLPSLNQELSEELKVFLNHVSLSYYNNDDERSLNKHIFGVASKEYEGINQQLRNQKKQTDAAILDLLKALDKTSVSETKDEPLTNLIYLSELINQEIALRKQTEASLKKAKLDADKANQSKSDFISHISHEIRNPLNIIIGISHLLETETYLPSQKKYIDAIQINSNSLKLLVNDVLDFSKIEAQKIELVYDTFSFTKLIADVKTAQQLNASDKNIKINAITDPNIAQDYYGDSHKLTQVITNLTSNAIKFTDVGEVTLKLELINNQEQDSTLKVSVIDSGIGLSQEDISVIFDEYSQAKRTASRHSGGTGLGLSISKKLLQLMGTTLQVKSEVNIGSTFYFEITLPKVQDQQKINPKLDSKEIVKSNQQMHELVVDDSVFNYMVIEKLLAEQNITSIHADSGETAVDGYHLDTYDMIFMDVHMDGIDGFETSRQIRELDKKTPIYTLTGSVDQVTNEKCKKLGIKGVFSKPIDPDRFVGDLQKIKQHQTN